MIDLSNERVINKFVANFIKRWGRLDSNYLNDAEEAFNDIIAVNLRKHFKKFNIDSTFIEDLKKFPNEWNRNLYLSTKIGNRIGKQIKLLNQIGSKKLTNKQIKRLINLINRFPIDKITVFQKRLRSNNYIKFSKIYFKERIEIIKILYDLTKITKICSDYVNDPNSIKCKIKSSLISDEEEEDVLMLCGESYVYVEPLNVKPKQSPKKRKPYIKRDINCKNNKRLKKSNGNSDKKEIQVFDNKIFSEEEINCIN